MDIKEKYNPDLVSVNFLKSIFNKMNLLKLKLFLGNNNYLNLIKQSCQYFYNDFNDERIRYKVV